MLTRATLQALQGRELSLKNIRGVIDPGDPGRRQRQHPVTSNVRAGQVEAMLDNTVAGIDDALLKAK